MSTASKIHIKRTLLGYEYCRFLRTTYSSTYSHVFQYSLADEPSTTPLQLLVLNRYCQILFLGSGGEWTLFSSVFVLPGVNGMSFLEERNGSLLTGKSH